MMDFIKNFVCNLSRVSVIISLKIITKISSTTKKELKNNNMFISNRYKTTINHDNIFLVKISNNVLLPKILKREDYTLPPKIKKIQHDILLSKILKTWKGNIPKFKNSTMLCKYYNNKCKMIQNI